MPDPEDNSKEQADDQTIESSVSDLHLEVSEEDDSDGGDEFTLETLSEAYAEVVGADQEDDVEDLSDEDDSSPEDEDEEHEASTTEVNDDAACPVSPESIIESILFVGSPSDVHLTGKKIAAILRDVSPKEVGQIVKKLNTRYEEQNAAWRISKDKDKYRMVLHESLDSFKDDYFGRNREYKLNQSAIDVLAVVAYHQPMTREEIDKVRGKSSGGVLNQLIKRQLLIKEKTDEAPARKLYRTTDRFLDLFGLEELADLPQSHEVADIEELAD